MSGRREANGGATRHLGSDEEGADAAPDARRRDPLAHEQRRARRPQSDTPLRRTRDDRWIAGVAGGIARFTGARPGVVRAVVALSVPISLGITALGYLLLWLLIPVDA